MRDAGSLRQLERYRVAAFLLDTHVPGEMGGTGRVFDWTLAARAASAGPVILSGGLTVENVAQAIQLTSAPAVDVSSGVESAPGVKDPDLIRAFVAAVRRLSLEGT